MNKPVVIVRSAALVCVLVLLDQGTKQLARHVLAGRPLTAGPVGLVLTMNRGVAFGLFGDSRWIVPLNALLGVIVALAVAWAARHGERGLAAGFLLIFAGFLGNFIDRLATGQVTDFFWVRGWSVFNVADCLVTVGAILCGLALMFPERWGYHAGA